MKSTCINSITKIIASVLIVFVIINNPVFSQIKENYVIEWVYHGFNGAQLQATIQYVDGLGLPLQTVSFGTSPTGNDVVQPFAYAETVFEASPLKGKVQFRFSINIKPIKTLTNIWKYKQESNNP